MADLSYYLKYINFQSTPQDDIQEMSDSYSQQLSNSISAFSVRINSNEAISVKLNDINSTTTHKALLNFRKVKNASEDSVVRNIQMYPNTIKQGDYVYYNNEIYLAITKVENKPIYNHEYSESLLKVCNNNLKFITSINDIDTLFEIPCILSNGIIALEENKYITTPSNQLTCIVGTSYIDKIKYIKDSDNPTRFIVGGKTYKTIGIDNTTNVDSEGVGIIIIKLEEDEQSEYDDLLNSIANRWNATNPKPNYVIDIADLTTVNRGGASNFVYSIKNNGVEVVNPSMTITIANTSIATYNSVNKTISGINTGTTTLTMVFHGADDVDYVYTGNVRVILSTSGDVNTYQILTNDPSVKGENLYTVPRYITKTFYAQRYLNGVMMDANYTVNYSLVNCTANQVEITINNGKVDVYNKSAINNGASINFTFMDTVTRISSIKTINLVS